MSRELTKLEKQKLVWAAKKTRLPESIIDKLRDLTPSRSPKSTKGKIKIAFVVGHKEQDTGAYAEEPLNMGEWTWNKMIGEEMVKLANDDPSIEVKVFYFKNYRSYSRRIDEGYGRVNAWRPNVIIEGHFNWLAGAGRVEMLHYATSKKGKELSEILLENVGDLMRTPETRRRIHARGKADRGGRSLWAGNVVTVMPEPFDCTYQPHVDLVHSLSPEDFARVYINSVKQFKKII